MSVSVRDATIELLRAFGMTTMFGNPGSTELPLFRDFPGDFRYVLGLQESIALGMADGYAQASGNAAFVNLHSSVGVGHAAGAIFTAFRNQTPLVISAGQQARSILPFEPYLFADRPTEFPRPFVKWACEPARAQDVPAAIARAYYVAMEAPRGPTFVSIPVDDWDEPGETLAPRRITTTNPGDASQLNAIAEALAAAAHPVIVVGAGAARDGAWDETIALAERHGAAVWAAPLSARNSFPEDHPLFAGFLPPRREQIVAKLAGADVILVLGGPMSLYHVEGAGPHAPPDAQIYLIGDNHAHAAWAPLGTAVVANVKAALAALLSGPAPRQRVAGVGRSTRAALDGGKFNDAYVLQQVARLRPRGAVIVEEAPSSRPSMHDHLPIVTRDGFYTTASGGLGYGLPASIGIALARPREKIIAVLGDGSALYAIQGLWSAAQLSAPVSFIIIKNGVYEALKDFGRHFGLQKTIGTDLPAVDFCALARGQGLPAQQASNVEQLDAALRWSFEARTPTLVEVVVG